MRCEEAEGHLAITKGLSEDGCVLPQHVGLRQREATSRGGQGLMRNLQKELGLEQGGKGGIFERGAKSNLGHGQL